MGLKRTARFYKKNSASRKKKNQYQKKYNSTEAEKENRRELGKIRYKAKKAGKNIKNKDFDHSTGKFEKSSVNRGRKEKSRRKGSKRG